MKFVLRFLLLAFLAIVKSIPAIAQLPTQAEYDALMDLYASTNGSQWTNNVGWSSADPNVVQSVAGWYGIYTDANGHITHLDLDGILDYSYYTNSSGIQEYPGNNLFGAIPSTIGNLTWLKVLNLGGNRFTTGLPVEIGNLTELQMLVVARAQLSGSIPATIGNCTKLVYFFLEFNQLTGSIPGSIGNLTELWAIQLHYNQLSGPVPPEFGNLKKLVFFHLFGNQLSGSIPPELGGMTQVGSFGLYGNQLSGSIPFELGRLKNAIVIHLGSNQLSGNLPDSLSRLTKLSTLILENNRLSGVIPPSIASVTTLANLQVHSNGFSHSDIQQFKNLFNGTLHWGYQKVGLDQELSMAAEGQVVLSTLVDRNISPPSTYQWFRGGVPISSVSEANHTITISPEDLVNQTEIFSCRIRNSIDPNSNVWTASYIVRISHLQPSYIRRITTLTAGKVSTAELDQPNPGDESINIDYEYFDGLGRPIQTVLTRRSPDHKDVVTPFAYDELGRQVRSYLPFTYGNDGGYKENKFFIGTEGQYVGPALSFYSNPASNLAVDTRPFGETVFEPSPLNRPLKDYGPGLAWSVQGSDKPVTHQYLSNLHSVDPNDTEGESIIAWKINAQGVPEPAPAPVASHIEAGGYYSSNQLSIKVTVDEQGHAVREYTNKQGQVILKKVQAVTTTAALNNPSHWAFTYYIYDDLDNLVFVLQPEGYKQYLAIGQQ